MLFRSNFTVSAVDQGLYSAFSDRLRDTAILTTMVFAGGLVAGRVLSFILDGRPAPLLIFYAVLEFVIIPVAWWV